MTNLKLQTEGSVEFYTYTDELISKEMDVFYNPIMALNRSISVAILKSLKNKDLNIALPLCGTGIRGLRFLVELPEEKIKEISFNDLSNPAIELVKKNIKHNKIKSDKTIISNLSSDQFLLNSKGFDYIDIDPFGNPSPFLDLACKKLSRDGILAVTATDPSALCGTHPRVCERKYWAKPLRNHLKHEIGLRILIRKVQLVAAQYEKALTPIYSYSWHHYMRVFFVCKKGCTKADQIIKKHQMFEKAGPLWTGQLLDKSLAKSVNEIVGKNLTELLEQESQISQIGFYDIGTFSKTLHKSAPKLTQLSKKISDMGYSVARTHFAKNGIKSSISPDKLKEIF